MLVVPERLSRLSEKAMTWSHCKLSRTRMEILWVSNEARSRLRGSGSDGLGKVELGMLAFVEQKPKIHVH